MIKNNAISIKVYFLIFGLLYGQSDIYESRKTAITKAIEKVGPAVASINVEQTVSAYSSPDPFFRYFFPPEIYPLKSSGSGVVISPDGYVLTNTHVIEKASKITATLSGGETFEIGRAHV